MFSRVSVSEPATFTFVLHHAPRCSNPARSANHPIEKIRLPLQSRDELPPILAGLQWIWMHPTLKAEILGLLKGRIHAGKQATGRTGMDLWQMLGLGVVRLGLDADCEAGDPTPAIWRLSASITAFLPAKGRQTCYLLANRGLRRDSI
jgi:hypothetical protein